MSYRNLLLKQIAELEQRIANSTADKAELEQQLQKLKLSEFEEDMRESNEQILLKS
jgi:Fe-S-cluster formation regulator IscX/YfhJ